jgi:hypothetical protein
LLAIASADDGRIAGDMSKAHYQWSVRNRN